jgi:hypothetical protein
LRGSQHYEIDSLCTIERRPDSAMEWKVVFCLPTHLFWGIVGTELTVYEYYDNGNQKMVSYPNGAREEYIYYTNNLLHTLKNYVNNDLTDSYVYTYDAANNQETKQETIQGIAKGTTTYTYDELKL